MSGPSVYEAAEIKGILLNHIKWLKGEGGRRGDLSFRNLAGFALAKYRLGSLKLTGANLAGADLSGSDLTSADLFGADLEGANLTDAILIGADFRGANLHRAILSGCNLRGADFRSGVDQSGGTRLTEATLDHAMLCEAKLMGCDLSGADLHDADLSGADLSQAVLLGAELSGATLAGVKLGGTVLELSRLSSVQQAALTCGAGDVTAPTYTILANGAAHALFGSHEQWIATGGTSGRRLDMEGVRFEACTLAGRNLSGARLRRCDLSGLDLSGTRLEMADLSYTDLQEAGLEEASLLGATLRRANLSRARLAGASLEPMALPGDRNWPANLDGALLHDADLTNAVLNGAVMTGADLGGCILSGTRLKGVDLAKVKRSALVADGPGPRERRKARRFTEPGLFVRTAFGTFPAQNWSFGGLCLDWDGSGAVEPGQELSVHIAAREAEKAAADATLAAVEVRGDRGETGLRFAAPAEAVTDYLNALVPRKYRRIG